MAKSFANQNINIKGKFFRLEVAGFSEVLQGLHLMQDQKKNLQKFLKQEATRIIKTAKDMVPKDTHSLKESHRILTFGTGTGKRMGQVRVDIVAGGIIGNHGRMIDYAAVVHEGSSKLGIKARPWLANAIEKHKPGYTARLAKAIKLEKLGL